MSKQQNREKSKIFTKIRKRRETFLTASFNNGAKKKKRFVIVHGEVSESDSNGIHRRQERAFMSESEKKKK